MIAGEETPARGKALAAVRASLVERLRARRSEIEGAIFARVNNDTFDPVGSNDAEYVAGLRATVTAVVDYGLTGIEQGEEWPVPIPSAAVAQAQRAARNGVGLETVLLRYAAGQRLLTDFVMAEADQLPGQAVRGVLETQGMLAERIMAVIATEYKREVQRAGRSLEQRRAERVQRLLAGEALDTAELRYDFNAWHLGVIAAGAGAREALQGLRAGPNRQLLAVWHGEETVWVWLGGQQQLGVTDVERSLPPTHSTSVSLALGEPGRGVEGWRLTHHQAQAALSVAIRRPCGLTRYGDYMLLAAAMRDETLARSLTAVYLAPLADQRDGGAVLRDTLRAYIATGRNVSSAAAALEVARHTVEKRLRVAEESLGRALNTCLAELEVALRLDELAGANSGASAPTSEN